MLILMIWRLRSIFANLLYTVTNVLAVVIFFSLMTWTTVYPFVSFGVSTDQTDGLIRYLVNFAQSSTILVCAFMLFSLFALSVISQQDEYQILHSLGTSGSQILWQFFGTGFALNAAGIVFGVPCGCVLAWAMWPNRVEFRDYIRDILSYCAEDLRTCILIAVTLVFITRFFTIWFLLPDSGHYNHKVNKPDELFRPTLIRRIFGIGGEYASINRRRRIEPRISLMIACVLGVFSLAVMCAMLQSINSVSPRVNMENGKLYFEMISDNDPAFTEKGEAIVQTVRSNDAVQSAAVCRVYQPKMYCLLEDAWSSDAYRTAMRKFSPVPTDFKYNTCFAMENGKTMLYRPALAFLDDATFDELAQKRSVDAGQNCALLYNYGLCRGGYVDLLRDDAQGDMTICLQPRNFSYTKEFKKNSATDTANEPQDNDDQVFFLFGALRDRFSASRYAEQADACSVPITVRLAGVVKDDPCDLFHGACTVILPERMRASFRKDGFLDEYALSMRVNINTNEAACDDVDIRIWQEIKRLGLEEKGAEQEFGSGRGEVFDAAQAYSNTRFNVINYLNLRYSLQKFQNQTLIFAFLFCLMMAFLLFTNIVNIVHKSHSVRRLEKKTLIAMGIQRKQRWGMLLYESTLYSVRCVLVAVLLFLLLFPFISVFILQKLSSESLDLTMLGIGLPIRTAPDIPFFQFFWSLYRNLLPMTWYAFQTWWGLFLVASALIFIAYFIVNDIALIRSQREDTAIVLREVTDE